jgi:hypothetical protein
VKRSHDAKLLAPHPVFSDGIHVVEDFPYNDATQQSLHNHVLPRPKRHTPLAVSVLVFLHTFHTLSTA